MLQTNPRKSPPQRPDSSLSPSSTRGLTMLRSIEVKPSSLDSQQIMMRLLMISMQLDRKDYIIRQLLTAASNNEEHDIINQLSIRCQRYETEIKTLTQTISMLKDNIANIETYKSKQMLSSASLYNEQLESKMMSLESKLRKAQEDKIELEEELKKNKMNQSMAEYQLIKNQQNEKSRARELESLLMTERNKLENQRKISIEKNIVIEDLKNRIVQVQNRQRYVVQQYEERIKLIQHEMTFQETMKKSQIVSTEEKINASVQEINKLAEENRNLKQNIEQLRQNIQTKERELATRMAEHRALENQFHRLQNEFRECNIKLEARVQEFRVKDRQILEKENLLKKMQTETEQLRFHLSTKTQQMDVYSEQVNRLKSQLTDLYNQLDSHKMQIRKLKRKPNSQTVICQSCRVRENSLVSNQKKIKILDISEILEQTEAVLRSNRKIQSLISLQEERGIDSQFKAYREQAYNA